MRTSTVKQKGVITVEAALILPVFIIVMCLILSVMKLCYFHLVMQQAVQNVGIALSEYGYVIDRTVGLNNFAYQEDTKQKESKIKGAADTVIGAFGTISNDMKGQLSLSTIGKVIEDGKQMGEDINTLISELKDVKGEDIVNYLFVSAMNEVGGDLIKWMVGDYLKAMGSQNNTIQNINYELFVEENSKDILIFVTYEYKFPYFIKDNLPFRQMVRVHPWVGGKTKGLYSEKLFGTD